MEQTGSVTITIRPPSPDDLPAMFRRDQDAFFHTVSEEARSRWAELLELGRFRLAEDDGLVVGVAGSHALDLTVPGGAAVPMTGTTWVSVAPTHRRRGVLRQLLDEVHRDGAERGDVVAGLLASEGGIYERFGYGVATWWRIVELDRRLVQLRDDVRPEQGAVTIVDPADHVDEIAERYDRARGARVGEVSRTAAWIGAHVLQEGPELRAALHQDGFALWKVTADWGEGDPAHELRVHDLVWATPEAHRALWHLLLSIDLVGPIRSRTAVALDDPLALLLTDPRRLRTVALNDMLWVRPSDVPALLSARRYRVAGELSIEVTGPDGRTAAFRIEGGPDGARVEPHVGDVDVRVSTAALGSLSLGGVSATVLAGAGRAAGDDAAIAFADLFFGWQPLPFCSTAF